MTKERQVLVVGGGIAGMATTIMLRRLGAQVLLIDLDPGWRVYGAGITITGPTLRAMKQLGIYDEVAAQAYVGQGIRICDAQGQPIDEVATPIAPDAGVAGCGGIMRPLLHRIMSAHVRECGAQVRLGLTVDALTDQDNGVQVQLSDSSEHRFDLVVGADGLFSRVRQLLFPQAEKPRYMGQYVWRTVAPRPRGLDQRHFFLGGPHKVGLTPVSPDAMYMFLLETSAQRGHVPDADLAPQLSRLLASYGGPLREIRESLSENSPIIVRPLEAFRLPRPWSRGNTLLIGDAAHPTTPQLASGAGLAIEDALVLAEELRGTDHVASALQRFMQRRYERCQLVVENSFEIGNRERAGAPAGEQTEILARSLAALAEDI